MPAPLRDRLLRIPAPYDASAAERLIAGLGPRLDGLDERARAFLAGVGGASPYLSRLLRWPDLDVRALFETAPEEWAATEIAATRTLPDGDDDTVRKALRVRKANVALVLGLAEIAGAMTALEAAALLSAFADAACDRALRQALIAAADKGFVSKPAEAPERVSGIAIIAMGKLGAGELNYSSDIDLIVIYDPEAPSFPDPASARDIAVGATRRMVAHLNDQTRDGYVFRTDLRLRPDPGVSAAALSINAAESYYEAHGQNWERAAYIRARAAAGDLSLGDDYLKRLRPFVWRRHLDYATIDDVNSLLRQIHAAKGGASIEFSGQNVKTGRGGIREIEFLIQTRQLILGGQNEALRGRGVFAMLDALCEADEFTRAEADALSHAYDYLRRLEHALQMIADEQTHTIPEEPAAQDRLAHLLCAPDAMTLERDTLAVMRSVHCAFAARFDARAGLATEFGSLSFTGVEADPATIATLHQLGFEAPAAVIETVRRWHFGELRATRSERARNLLTGFTPKLLEALSEAVAPDEAFRAFDLFLRGLPAGVQIFSLFTYNPAVFDALIRIVTVAPYLGRELARRADLVEALTELDWPGDAPTPEALRSSLSATLRAAVDYEAQLNAVRRWAARERFDVGAQLVVGHIEPGAAATRFSAIAETAIGALFPVVAAEAGARFGAAGGALVVLGLGRLGARRMTAASDVDLMFIYDAPDGAGANDPVAYYARLVRRYVAAIAAPTEEGALYEVDMQLRPSGKAGPVAVSFDAFRRYYEADAWTWERMALVKARVIAGDPDLGARIAAEIDAILARPAPAASLARDVVDMRERLAAARRPTSVFDVKAAPGGLTDLDFIAQFLLLRHRPRLADPAVRADTIALLGALRDQGFLAPPVAASLCNAGELFETVLQVSRAASGGAPIDPEKGGALAQRLSEALGQRDLARAASSLMDVCETVRMRFGEIVERAAEGA